MLSGACSSTSSTAPRPDAEVMPDVALSTGGAVSTGGVRGSGGVVGTGGVAALGGAVGTGGSVSTGGSSAATGGAAGGVLLTATYDGQVHATWSNRTSQSIFLAGCGTVEWSRFEGSVWVDHGGFVMCGWEGIAVEVAAGASYTETQSFPKGESGRYRLSGKYGVGCTPGAGLSKADCTAFFTATSNEVEVSATTGTGGARTGGASGGFGGAGGTTSVGSGGATSIGTGGATGQDAGQASIYSGCRYIGGYNRAVIAKFDPEAGICVAIVLVEPDRTDAGLGLTISENWGLEGTGIWPSTTSNCATRALSTARPATSAQGSVSVSYSPATIDVDAVLTFPASDAGPAQTVEMKAKGVDNGHGC
jgi:hypothetical protein